MTDFWKDRHVLVTGATGLVGSWLVKALVERQAVVVGLVRDVDLQSELYRSRVTDQITVVNGELEEFRTLERAISQHEIETVFHLAAQTIVPVAHRSPLTTFESNIRGTYHLLEACRFHRDLVGRVVVASSDKAYGEQGQTYHEDMALTGRHPYEVSKVCAEFLTMAYHHTYGLPVAVTRCGNIFGGGDLNWSRIVPGTIRSLLLGERPVLRSDGQSVRDYLYVEDVIDALLVLAEQLEREEVRGQAFNFSLERPLTVLEIVTIIQRLMDSKDLAPVILNQAQGELIRQALSSQRARDVLGWRPRWALEEGLARTVDWYRQFLASAEVVP